MAPKKTIKHYIKSKALRESEEVKLSTISTSTEAEVKSAYDFTLKIAPVEEMCLKTIFEHLKADVLKEVLTKIKHNKGVNLDNKIWTMMSSHHDIQNVIKLKDNFEEVLEKTHQMLKEAVISECSKGSSFDKEKLNNRLEVEIAIKEAIVKASAPMET